MNQKTTHELNIVTRIVLNELPVNWKWMIGVGLLMIILGTLGLIASSVLTLTSVLIFGGFIFAAGIIQFAHAIQAKEKEWGGKLQHFAIAIIYIVAGLVIFWDPFSTSFILMIFLASVFAVIGVARIWYAFYCKRQDWRWLLPALLGLFDLVLTGMILATLPESAFWLIGLFIAIEILFNGWFILFLGLRVRKTDVSYFDR